LFSEIICGDLIFFKKKADSLYFGISKKLFIGERLKTGNADNTAETQEKALLFYISVCDTLNKHG